MKIKISERATHARNELLLLQNVSARVWQNFVAFSSVGIRQDFFIEGPVCGRRRPFQDCTERPAAAVVGSNQISKYISLNTGKSASMKNYIRPEFRTFRTNSRKPFARYS